MLFIYFIFSILNSYHSHPLQITSWVLVTLTTCLVWSDLKREKKSSMYLVSIRRSSCFLSIVCHRYFKCLFLNCEYMSIYYHTACICRSLYSEHVPVDIIPITPLPHLLLKISWQFFLSPFTNLSINAEMPSWESC